MALLNLACASPNYAYYLDSINLSRELKQFRSPCIDHLSSWAIITSIMSLDVLIAIIEGLTSHH